MGDFFSDSTALYFFSAVFQGNMALLALVGLFGVFKMQLLSNKIEAMDRSIASYTWEMFKQMNIDEFRKLNYSDVISLKDSITTISKQYENNPTVAGITKIVLRSALYEQGIPYIIAQGEKVRKTREDMRRPIHWTLGVIAMSLVGLPFSWWLHSVGPIPEMVTFSAIVIINGIALESNRSFVFESLL